MKELLGNARNHFVSQSEDGSKLRPMTEVALILTEPVFACDAAGSLVRSRATETIRFATTPHGLRILAKQFTEYAAELDALAKMMPADEPTPEE